MLYTRKTILSLFAFISIFFFACNSQPAAKSDTATAPTGGTVTVDEFEKQLNATAGAQLLDVRTPGEYAEGHLKSALNIDWNGNDFEASVQKLDKTKPVFVYCFVGGRSKEAAEFLSGKGFTTVYNMEGGYRKWTGAGKPTETGSAVAATETTKTTGLTMEEFLKLTASADLVLVDFNAPWCGPCKKLTPIVDEVEKEMNGKLKVIAINIDENEAVANALKIESIPALYAYRKGKLVWQQVGLLSKAELVSALSKI